MLSHTRKTNLPKIAITPQSTRNLKYGCSITEVIVMKLKKPILISFTILYLLFTPFLIRYKTSATANPNIIHVPTNYPTIQEAIDHANSGDTIFVHNGTYYEHVIIDKSLSLIGENRNSTIIDGEGTNSVILVAANNVYISGFTIQKSGVMKSGILIDSSGNNISHNTITNSSNGIYLSFSIRNTVFNNTVSDNKYGIHLDSSNNNQIHNNYVPDNKYGIALYSSDNNEIFSNNASSNKINGIHLQSSSYNVISCNIASLNNFDGISLDFSDNNLVSGNTVSNNDYGIRLDNSINNAISGNMVSNNYFGTYFYSSSNNNTIYHNNFIDNTKQVYDYDPEAPSINTWDDGHPSGGNYWSDYTGQDLNGDGIGDTPYVIDANNQDTHPLIGAFSDFNIIWEDKTYHATTICNSTISNLRFTIGRETGNRIISFYVTGEDGTVGFCRVEIPTDIMNYPYVVLVDEEEIIPTLLDFSNKTHVYLCITYVPSSHTITIISSKLMYLYNELLDKYEKLQIDFRNLNSTYYELLDNYSALLGDHTSLLLEHAHNIRSLMYVFIATTAIFIIAAVYLSTHAHRRVSRS